MPDPLPKYPAPPPPEQHPGPPHAGPQHSWPVPAPRAAVQGELPARSLGAALAWLAGFSVLAPLAVLLLGVLWFALKWLVAAGLFLVTLGMLAADEGMERWFNETLGWHGFGETMASLVPWAVGSFAISLVVGCVTVWLLRTTGAKSWHPALQGALGGLVGVLFALLGSIFVGA